MQHSVVSPSFLNRIINEDKLLFLLGLLLPTLSILGNCTQLLLWHLIFLFFGVRTIPWWGKPFIFLVTVWCGSRLGMELGLWSLAPHVSLLSFAGLKNFIDWFLVSPSGVSIVTTFLRICLPFLIYSKFKDSYQAFNNLSRGVAIGLIVSLFVSISSFWELTSFANQTSFWTGQGRIASSFTDPNAAGIFLALFLPILLSIKNLHKAIVVLAVISTIVVGLMSGSRTFILGLFLFVFIKIPNNRSRIIVGFCTLGLLLALNVFQASNPEKFKEIFDSSPPAISRVLNSISTKGALFSREAFFFITSRAWLENPVMGIGPSQFPLRVTEFAQRAHVSIGLWRDNPNNYYLGILVEYGLIGLIALFYGLTRLRLKTGGDEGARSSLIILSVLLLTGPHLDFDEVSILVGFLFAMGVEEKSMEDLVPFSFKIAAPIFAIAIFVTAYFGQAGLYEWEKDEDGFFRWTSVASKMNFFCDSDGKAIVKLRNALPGVLQKTDIYTSFAPPQSLNISADSKVELSCEYQGRRFKKISVTIINSHPWQPKDHGMGEDKRFLGVQIRLDPSARYE